MRKIKAQNKNEETNSVISTLGEKVISGVGGVANFACNKVSGKMMRMGLYGMAQNHLMMSVFGVSLVNPSIFLVSLASAIGLQIGKYVLKEANYYQRVKNKIQELKEINEQFKKLREEIMLLSVQYYSALGNELRKEMITEEIIFKAEQASKLVKLSDDKD